MQSPIYLQVLLIGLQAPNVSQLIEESALAAHLTPPTHTHTQPSHRPDDPSQSYWGAMTI